MESTRVQVQVHKKWFNTVGWVNVICWSHPCICCHAKLNRSTAVEVIRIWKENMKEGTWENITESWLLWIFHKRKRGTWSPFLRWNFFVTHFFPWIFFPVITRKQWVWVTGKQGVTQEACIQREGYISQFSSNKLNSSFTKWWCTVEYPRYQHTFF